MVHQSVEELRETVFMTEKLLNKDFEVIKTIVNYLSRHGQASGYQMRRVIKQSRSHSYFTKFLVDCGVLYKPKYQYFELGEAHADPTAYEIASRQFRNWYRTNHQQHNGHQTNNSIRGTVPHPDTV
jgi:hypothetical protein